MITRMTGHDKAIADGFLAEAVSENMPVSAIIIEKGAARHR